MTTPKRSNSMTSPDEEGRSPKRQRRSFSPASPPTDAKTTSLEAPQTPPPSVHMSPEWSSQQLPGLGTGVNGGSASVTMPTPPNTAGFQSQMMARGASSETGNQTPMIESDGQEVEKGEGISSVDQANTQQSTSEDSGKTQSDSTDAVGDNEHRRTDHERQDDTSDLPGSKVLYKLRADPIPPTSPHPSHDLIKLYSLERLQASVARRDPVTGAKINKLRKSYEGKIKTLGLEGRNKATATQNIIYGFMDPGWDQEIPEQGNKPMWEVGPFNDPPLMGEDDGASAMGRIEGLLDRALDLRPGHLPQSEHNEWKNMLGLDDTSPLTATAAKAPTLPAAATPTVATAPRTAASNLLSKTAPATAVRNSAPASPRNALRPERAGKKRRYDESSYAGYQEGYEDDGYSTGGLDDAGGRRGSGGSAAKRQKRKDFPSTNSASPPFASNAGAGNSMVGVKSS